MALKIIRLEERIVLEAAAADAVEAVDHLADMGDPSADPSASPDQAVDSATETHAPGDAQGAESAAGHGVHVLAVASTVNDAQALAGAAVQGVLTYVYDGHSIDLNAILADIQDMLGGQQADSIAFATETGGAAGQFCITDLDAVNLESLADDPGLVAFWKGVGDLVSEDGRIDILSCETGAGDEGSALVQALADITGRDVAASDDPTGSTDLGGDWVLEQGDVDLAAVYFDSQALEDYHGVLGTAPTLDASYDHMMDAIDMNVMDSGGQQVSDFIDASAISDPDGVLESIAVTGADTSHGEWQYLDNGVWTSFGAVSTSNALLLHSDDYVRFVPDADYVGTATFEFHAWDERNYFNYFFNMESASSEIYGDWGYTDSEQYGGEWSIRSLNDVQGTMESFYIDLDIYGSVSVAFFFRHSSHALDGLVLYLNGQDVFYYGGGYKPNWLFESHTYHVAGPTTFKWTFINNMGLAGSRVCVDSLRIFHTPRYDDASLVGGSTPYSTASDTVSLVVQDPNLPPDAVDDTGFSTNEDSSIVIAAAGLLANDTDPEGASLTLVSVSAKSASGADVWINADGDVVYDPTGSAILQALAQGDSATDTFTYTITDGKLTDTATVTIDLTGLNDAPVANIDFTTTITEDSGSYTVSGNLITGGSNPALSRDWDPDQGAVLTITEINGDTTGTVVNEYGTLTWSANGAYTFVLDNSATAVQALNSGTVNIEAFTYTLSDEHGATDQGTLALRLSGVNDAPVAHGDTGYTTYQDTMIAIPISELVANDTDVDNPVLSIASAGPVSDNRAQISVSNGYVYYDPRSSPMLIAGAEGELVYDYFTYTVTDNAGGTDTARVRVVVTCVNDRPFVYDQTGAANEDSAVTIAESALLAYAHDPDNGDTVSLYSVQTVSSKGASVTLNADGSVTYDPTGSAILQALADGATTTDTFQFTGTDGKGGFRTATMTMTVTGVNDAPTPQNLTLNTDEDTPAQINVLIDGQDIDTPGSALSLGAWEYSGQGLVTVTAGNVFAFDPNGAFEGLAEGETVTAGVLTYDVVDPYAGHGMATVTITVTGVNDDPDAASDAYAAGEDSVLNVAATADGVLANDSDVDGDSLTVSAYDAVSAQGAAVSVKADGTFSYDPTAAAALQSLAQGATLNDSFTYTVTDGHGGSDTATVTVTVTGANDAPVAGDDSGYSVSEDAILSVAGPGILANDTDPDTGDTLSVGTYDAVSARGATVTVELSTGAFIYNPKLSAELQALADGETVTDTFTYTCLDSQGLWDTATVTVTITGVNDAPIAVPDAAQTTENAALIGNLITSNDTDVDHGSSMTMDSFTVDGTTYTFGPGASEFTVTLGRGTLHVWANGDYLFDPGTGYDQLTFGQSALETFTYLVRDEHGAVCLAPATVTLIIQGEIEETTPLVTPGGLYLGWSMHGGSAFGLGPGGQGNGGAGGSIQGHGDVLAGGLGLMNRDNPWGPAYPDRPFLIETYLENTDAAKDAFNDAVDALPGVSQLTKVALKDFNADILDHLLGHDQVALGDLQDMVNDLSDIIEHMSGAELAQFRGVLAVWLQSLKIQATALADVGEDVETLLDQLNALAEQLQMSA